MRFHRMPVEDVRLSFASSELTEVHSVEDAPAQSERRARMPIPRPQATNHPAVTGAPPSEARRELLRNSTLFSHLDDAEADAILADAQVRHYSERAQIFAKGDRGDSMMAVLHGRVVISDSSLDGRQVVLTTLR